MAESYGCACLGLTTPCLDCLVQYLLFSEDDTPAGLGNLNIDPRPKKSDDESEDESDDESDYEPYDPSAVFYDSNGKIVCTCYLFKCEYQNQKSDNELDHSNCSCSFCMPDNYNEDTQIAAALRCIEDS